MVIWIFVAAVTACLILVLFMGLTNGPIGFAIMILIFGSLIFFIATWKETPPFRWHERSWYMDYKPKK